MGTPSRTNGSNNNSSNNENFAWSAFQSSPDASKLPIPAFNSPTTDSKSVLDDTQSTQMISHLLSRAGAATGATTASLQLPTSSTASSSLPPPPPLPQPDMLGMPNEDDIIANAPRAEDLEDQWISEAKQKQQQTPELPEAPKTPSLTDESPSETPVSKTGVNLAAALKSSAGDGTNKGSSASSGNSSTTNAGDEALSPQPQSTSQGQSSSSTTRRTQYSKQPTQQQNQQQQVPVSHTQGHSHPQQHQQYPPGYMTINVQVPHLLPGRHMFVNTPPNGYPVQIVVPEGIPPGMR